MFVMPDETEELLIKRWPVVISKPADEGRVVKHEIQVDYVLLTRDEFDVLLEASREEDGDDDAILQRVVRGMYGIQDANGNSLEFSTDLLKRMTKIPYVRAAVLNGYFTANAGQKAKRKN